MGSRNRTPPFPDSWGRRARFLLYAVATNVAVLALANAVVQWLEDAGVLSTYRGMDDYVRYVDESVFEDGGDGWWRTTAYAHGNMVPSRFRAVKAGWRMFGLGESFMMGSPYTWQKHDEERPGGILSWLRADLSALAGGREVEVINSAAGGANAFRVRKTLEQVLDRDPDVVLIATGNNEGVPRPAKVTEEFRRLGGFRLISRWVVPAADLDARSDHTPQIAPLTEQRAEFREHIRAMLRDAAARGVRVILCTLPINLRYEGWEWGHPMPGEPYWDETTHEPMPACIESATTLYRESPWGRPSRAGPSIRCPVPPVSRVSPCPAARARRPPASPWTRQGSRGPRAPPGRSRPRAPRPAARP